MPASEPSRPWQTQKHQEILNQSSPTAFAQLSELALPHLITFLQKEFRQVENHLCETAAIDCLITYHQAPEKFNPDKLTLFAYLRMSARHDLLNALDKAKRQGRPLINIDEPSVQPELIDDASLEDEAFALDAWLDGSATASEQIMLQNFETNLNSIDRQLFLLILNGVRETEPYAEILGITDAPIAEQRHEVKKAKDRLTKSLTRFINRHKV